MYYTHRPHYNVTVSLKNHRNPRPVLSCPVPFPQDLSSITDAMSQTPTATSSTANYQSIFDNALEAYKKKTKKSLRSHPLFAKLQTCNSPDAVLTILQEQIPSFDQSHSNINADDKFTNWLNPTVNVLYTFSSTIGGGISLVSIKASEVIFFRFDAHCFAGIPTCGVDLHWDRRPSLSQYHDL
jgi:hypothetical protein